jgi:predicted enzyme related to lactoylglutathione lyase
MPVNLAHFAINADDPDTSRTFYESVFGWTFQPFGPPGFFKVETGDDSGVFGALQKRRELIDGTPTVGLECTFGVDDVEDIAKKVTEAGGTIVLPRFTISGVGHLIFFKDPAGNAIGAMQYDSAAE